MLTELPEVKFMTDFINQKAKNQVFNSIIGMDPAYKFDEVKLPREFSLTASSRGKELCLILTDLRNKQITKIFIIFSLAGNIVIFDEKDIGQHHRLIIRRSDGKVIALHDVRRFSKVRIDTKWSIARGPDPIDEYAAFVLNVRDHLNLQVFTNQTISEILMDQRFFNGIGNYLRAELLHRLDINPFENARECLIKEIEMVCQGKDNLLEYCKNLSEEVIAIYKNKSSYKLLTDWHRCYRKPKMAFFKDSSERKLWFDKKWKNSVTNICAQAI